MSEILKKLSNFSEKALFLLIFIGQESNILLHKLSHCCQIVGNKSHFWEDYFFEFKPKF